MAGTEKLFYEDAYQKNFAARVLSCEADGAFWQIVLDRTAFFPEGGGQYGDEGYLNGVRVTDTQERNGRIFHRTEEPLEEGTEVSGRVDWSLRFDRMQQHSGEHIVSGIVHRRFGYENVGFHLGEDYCTMDFSGPITKDELREIEREANRAVFENLDILVSCPSGEELKNLEYRSKIEIEGQVRIITIPGYDVCACCAPHLKKTGEIGLIKLVDMVNYKGGERVTMLSGYRALKDYGIKQENARYVGRILCEKENEIGRAVERMKNENISLKGEIARLKREALSLKARDLPVEEITCVFDGRISENEPRELMNLLLERGASVCAVFAGTDEAGYRYVIGSRTEDVRPVSKALNRMFDGRGGGRAEMVQGSLNGQAGEIRSTIEKTMKEGRE